MTTRFEWIKLLLDKWTTIVPIFLFIGSAVGWTFSSVENAEKDELTNAMKDQIEVLVDYKPRAVNQKCNCNAIFSNLIKKHEKKHELDH